MELENGQAFSRCGSKCNFKSKEKLGFTVIFLIVLGFTFKIITRRIILDNSIYKDEY